MHNSTFLSPINAFFFTSACTAVFVTRLPAAEHRVQTQKTFHTHCQLPLTLSRKFGISHSAAVDERAIALESARECAAGGVLCP